MEEVDKIIESMKKSIEDENNDMFDQCLEERKNYIETIKDKEEKEKVLKLFIKKDKEINIFLKEKQESLKTYLLSKVKQKKAYEKYEKN